MQRIRYMLVLGLLLLAGPGLAATQLEVRPLYYRNAQEIVAAIQPHLAADESISGINGKLILRLRPQNRANILDLIRSLDAPPRQLVLSLRQAGSHLRQDSQAGVSGRFSGRRGEVQIGDDPRPGALRLQDRRRSGADTSTQTLRTLEGSAATIYVGQLIPLPRGVVSAPGDVVLHDGVYYEQITTGFAVRARLVGQRVLLEISPQRESLQTDGSVALQYASTTVEGELGRWIDIGGAVDSAVQSRSGLLRKGASSHSQSSRIEVKVEPAP